MATSNTGGRGHTSGTLTPDDPKRHIAVLYGLTIGASIAFLPTAFFALISQDVAPELAALMTVTVGLVLLWQWWLNSLYGLRHTALFGNAILTGLYLILNNVFVLLLVLLPALLVVGALKPHGWSLFQPFIAALFLLNVLDAIMDGFHLLFDPDRDNSKSVIHIIGDLAPASLYFLSIFGITSTDGGTVFSVYGMTMTAVGAAFSVFGVVIINIVLSLVIWFYLTPGIWIAPSRTSETPPAPIA